MEQWNRPPGDSQASRRALSVVDGGGLRPVPRVLVVGAEELDDAERRAIGRVERLGVHVHRASGVLAHARLKWLARRCEEWALGFQAVAVIAVDPEDVGMMLEAGVAYALETAGRDARAGADRTFPSRSHGGLAQAADALCELVESRRKRLVAT